MWNCCLFLVLIFSLDFLKTNCENHSCRVSINGCDYTLKLKGNLKCNQNQLQYANSSKRTKRTDDIDSDTTPITRHEFEKLSQKVSKTVDKLSVRVLRWWRKLARKIDDLQIKDVPRERSLAEDNHNCPERFIGLKDWRSCYLLSNFNTSWYDAKQYCGAFDGDLVSMGTVKEHYLLTFLIKNNPEFMNAEGWWTSGSYLGNRKQWLWTSQYYNKQFTFINWGIGEPNEDGSQCMMLKRNDDHKWHDEICTQRYNFICEVQTTSTSVQPLY